MDKAQNHTTADIVYIVTIPSTMLAVLPEHHSLFDPFPSLPLAVNYHGDDEDYIDELPINNPADESEDDNGSVYSEDADTLADNSTDEVVDYEDNDEDDGDDGSDDNEYRHANNDNNEGDDPRYSHYIDEF